MLIAVLMTWTPCCVVMICNSLNIWFIFIFIPGRARVDSGPYNLLCVVDARSRCRDLWHLNWKQCKYSLFSFILGSADFYHNPYHVHSTVESWLSQLTGEQQVYPLIMYAVMWIPCCVLVVFHSSLANGVPIVSSHYVFQVVRMLIAVLIMYALMWMPYRVVVVYNSLVDSGQQFLNFWFWFVCRVMAGINSAINPIIYNMLSIKFRRAFKWILCDSKFFTLIGIFLLYVKLSLCPYTV